MENLRSTISETDRSLIQAARRNKPSKIAYELLTVLHQIEAPRMRYSYIEDNIASSIQRCQQTGDAFRVDTITCPPFSVYSNVDMESLADNKDGEHLSNSWYMRKFVRFLNAFSIVRSVLGSLDTPIATEARVYFGNAGFIGTEALKGQLHTGSDQIARDYLAESADVYKSHFEEQRGQLKLEGARITFNNVTDLVPQLGHLPLDLYELADKLSIVPARIAIFNDEMLDTLGINKKIKETAAHYAYHYAGESAQPRHAYLKVGGFLLSYGLVGERLAHQDNKTDLLISGDPPGNYRNDFYYALLTEKGKDLAIITPSLV